MVLVIGGWFAAALDFGGGAEQFDGLTGLALSHRGPAKSVT
jgi:hypothetical protein